MNADTVTPGNLENARARGAELRNLLACMSLAATHPDPGYHEASNDLFLLAFSLCDEINASLSPFANKRKETPA